MSHVTVLGTGHMGAPIARRLLDTGHAVTVWNRSPERAAAVGARVHAATPADAVRDAEVVLVMLTDAPAVAAVLAAAAPALRPGSCVVQMSTIGPDETRALAVTLPAGVSYLDAPVGGSVDAAASGQLRIFAGGPDDALALAAPVLAALGTVRTFGPVGSGAAAKLVANTALVTALGAVHDTLAVAGALGVPREAAMRLLGAGPLAGALARLTSTTSSFATALAAKDARLALGAAPDAGVLSATAALLESAPTPSADIASVIPPAAVEPAAVEPAAVEPAALEVHP